MLHVSLIQAFLYSLKLWVCNNKWTNFSFQLFGNRDLLANYMGQNVLFGFRNPQGAVFTCHNHIQVHQLWIGCRRHSITKTLLVILALHFFEHVQRNSFLEVANYHGQKLEVYKQGYGWAAWWYGWPLFPLMMYYIDKLNSSSGSILNYLHHLVVVQLLACQAIA